MDVLGLLKEVSGLGIDSLIVGAVLLLYVRYSASETRREISKEIDDKIGAFKNEVQQSFQELRQEIIATRTTLEESVKENRQEIAAVRTESRQEFNAARTYSEQSHKEMRQEFNAARTNSEQAHKETRQELKDIMLHLIDVRERLANIEGRLGAPTPRMSGVSPPLEAPAEEPSAQS